MSSFSSFIVILSSLLLLPLVGQSQQKVQVVTRTVQQSWPCPTGTAVHLRAEKATVYVEGWDKPTVQLVLRLSARHADRAVAEQDLAASRYHLQQRGTIIDVFNYYLQPAGSVAVQSDLRAEYTLRMPAAAALELANSYGQTQLVGLTGRQQLQQQFGTLQLDHVGGTINATVRFADLVGTDVQANLTCDANKSAVELQQLGGTCYIHNYYGQVRIQPGPQLKRLTIAADRTDVVLSAAHPEKFSWNLGVDHAELAVPPAYQSRRQQRGTRATLEVPATGPLIKATTNFAPLTLQTLLFSSAH